MEREVMFTGIGGQGVQLAAQVLARAAVLEGRDVSVLGTYGGTMRGGPTDCTVIVGDGPISQPPIVARSWSAIGAHPRYWEPVRTALRAEGVAVVNGDLFGDTAPGSAHPLPVAATARAAEIGAPLTASLLLLGAYARATQLVGLDALLEAMQGSVPSYRRQHLDSNARALRTGWDEVEPLADGAWSEASG